MYLIVIPILQILFAIMLGINFLFNLSEDRFLSYPVLVKIMEGWLLIIAPIFFRLFLDGPAQNDCCSMTAVFSPDHRLGIYLLIALSIIVYFYCSFRTRLSSPLLELLINALLIEFLALNVMLIIHLNRQDGAWIFWSFGNIPIILLIILMMKKNKRLLDEAINENRVQANNSGSFFIIKLLKAKAWVRFPILLVLSLPILVFLSAILFLFGQKPDTLIRAFTDTYRGGFSRLDYLCDNVECPQGHFLCTVGAKGHAAIVKPKRYGLRHGQRIICNRQLLVANAFEEWIEQHLPTFHRLIRKQYNKVGKVVHRYYRIFNKKWVSDLIYVGMKPIEWFFIFILYLFDTKPEDRIAKQYLSTEDKIKIQQLKNHIDKTTSYLV